MPQAELTTSQEDYLETIYTIVQEKQVARAKEIAGAMDVSMPSVTTALKSLASRGLIDYDAYSLVRLTGAGRNKAERIFRRHEILTDFLAKVLGIGPETAEDNACRMEHAVDDGVLEEFCRFAEFIETCPRAGADWVENFRASCQKGPEVCNTCVTNCHNRWKKRFREQRAGRAADTLASLSPGESGTILHVRGSTRTDPKFAEVAPQAGMVVEMERVAPDRQLLHVKLHGYHLSLRPEQAEGIEVRRLQGMEGTRPCRSSLKPATR